MAFLTAQKKYETIARKKVKPSMEEEINAEKLEELLGMNMSEATEAIKEQYMNRAKQQYFQTPVSVLTVKQDEPELEEKNIPNMLRYGVNLQKHLKNSSRVGNQKESVDSSTVLNPEAHMRALMQNVIDNLQLKLSMEQTTEVNEVVAEVMNTINILGAFIELTEDQITSDAVKEKLHSMKAWKLIVKQNEDMQTLAFEAIQNGTSKFPDIGDKLRIIEQDQERKMVSPTTGSLTEKMGLTDIGFRAFEALQESIVGVSEPNLIEVQKGYNNFCIDWTKINKEGDMEKTINQLEEQRTLLEHVAAGVAALDPEYKDYPAPMHLFYKMRMMLKDKSAPGYGGTKHTKIQADIAEALKKARDEGKEAGEGHRLNAKYQTLVRALKDIDRGMKESRHDILVGEEAAKGSLRLAAGGGKPRCMAYFHGGPEACPHKGGECSGWHVTSDQYLKTAECNKDKAGEVCKRGVGCRFRHKSDYFAKIMNKEGDEQTESS
jgi:hypothetical protein